MSFDNNTLLFTALSSLSINGRTHRHSLLPIFPSFVVNHTNESTLLLTNIPEYQLSREQYHVRCQYGYHERTSTRPTTDHQRRIAFLSRLWNINYSILECNFTRLMKFANLLGANRIHRFSTPINQAYLHENEYSIALEFFLQIDINLFYMKTCSYRGAIPLSSNENNNLFCMNEPQARYDMTQCHRTSCCLCYPSYKLTYRDHDKPIIQFGSHQQHRFINNYRSILNCPATCQTRNIIYVLTCPCHRVDYIGETCLSLPSRLSYHQKHGNRIMQQFLLGQKNISRIASAMKSNETLVKDDMALYQHSAQCPSAMQWFLDENPEYWPFVPQENHREIQEENETKITTTSSIVIDSDDNMFSSSYVQDVPSPPVNYRFTRQQKIEIDRFFHEKKYLNSPNSHLDLYQAAIVAIMPIDSSDALRRFIEALFITHTETQLNTDGHLDQLLFPDVMINRIDGSSEQQDHSWCKNLVHRRSPNY